MLVIHGNYFSEYQAILGWKTAEGWKYYEGLHELHPVVGIPELGTPFQEFLGDFAAGQEDVADFGNVRLSKSEEHDPEKFNLIRWAPVIQAFQLQLLGRTWGTCARVVFFGGKPKVRVMDDADGKLLATLYGGVPLHVGLDFRFFLPMMEQAQIPDMRTVDVSTGLKKLVKRIGNADDLFRVFQRGLET